MPKHKKKKMFRNFSNLNTNSNQANYPNDGSYNDNRHNTPYGYSDGRVKNNQGFANFNNPQHSQLYQNYGNPQTNVGRNQKPKQNFSGYENQDTYFDNFYGRNRHQKQRGTYQDSQNYQSSRESFEKSQEIYQNLQQNYQDLQQSFTDLQTSYQNLQVEYKNLQEDHIILQKKYTEKIENCDCANKPVSGIMKNTSLPVNNSFKATKLMEDVSSIQTHNKEQNEKEDKGEQNDKNKSWTDSFWKKHEGTEVLIDNVEDKNNINIGKKMRQVFTNQVEKNLAKMLAKPVEMSKGKSMLMKMGWDGGGLGKDGGGIVEPIAPKATYATTTMGLGNPTQVAEQNREKKQEMKNLKKLRKDEKRKLREEARIEQLEKSVLTDAQRAKLERKKRQRDMKQEKAERKNRYKLDILQKILDFVKDDTKVHYKFENNFTQGERLKVHRMIQGMNGERGTDIRTMGPEHADIAKHIFHHKTYILRTESDGVGRERRLNVFKEPPSNVYCVLPSEVQNESQNDIIINDQIEFIKDYESGDYTSYDEDDKDNEDGEVNKDSEQINLDSTNPQNEQGNELKSNDQNKGHDQVEMCQVDKDKIMDVNLNVADDFINAIEKNVETDNIKPSFNKTQNVDVDIKSKESEIKNEGQITEENEFEIVGDDLDQNKNRNNKSSEIKNSNDIEMKSNTLERKEAAGNQHKVTDINTVKNNTQHIKDVENKSENNLSNEFTNAKVDEILNLFIDNFKEFARREKLTEFRFLGAFNNFERQAINKFFDLFGDIGSEHKGKILEVVNGGPNNYKVIKDNNGSLIIKKLKKLKFSDG